MFVTTGDPGKRTLANFPSKGILSIFNSNNNISNDNNVKNYYDDQLSSINVKQQSGCRLSMITGLLNRLGGAAFGGQTLANICQKLDKIE
jgi:hypothetical protein